MTSTVSPLDEGPSSETALSDRIREQNSPDRSI
jgi:hypothetical protein